MGTLDEKDASTYRSIVSSLLYIFIKTRPDHCVAARSLGSHVGRPCDHNMVAAKEAQHYMKDTLER